ncbi:hypothetical protein ACQP1K_00560 [Sphaerimonospora sp. CA-214678]|uniref:hypothetical protein n=1 Tax=Sphaerimonospora sp. CA-214678 TaxID=3240029 RepID=UPI003D8F0A6B
MGNRYVATAVVTYVDGFVARRAGQVGNAPAVGGPLRHGGRYEVPERSAIEVLQRAAGQATCDGAGCPGALAGDGLTGGLRQSSPVRLGGLHQSSNECQR